MVAEEEFLLGPKATRPWKGRVAAAAVASFVLGALAATAMTNVTISKETVFSSDDTCPIGLPNCLECSSMMVCSECEEGYEIYSVPRITPTRGVRRPALFQASSRRAAQRQAARPTSGALPSQRSS